MGQPWHRNPGKTIQAFPCLPVPCSKLEGSATVAAVPRFERCLSSIRAQLWGFGVWDLGV